MDNLYNILGVGQDASEAEIKTAFRSLSKKYHPDANPGDKKAEEQFRKISEAYALLHNPQKRRDYDKKLREEQQKAFPGASGRKNTSSASGVPEVDFSDMGKQFAQFFGFDPKSPDLNHMGGRAAAHATGKAKTNPIDMTDMFEKYMGIPK